MRREEKRRKFHEAVVKLLYPPPSPPPLRRQDEDRSVRSCSESVDVGYDSGDLEGSGCSASGEDGEGEGKLSRAQRKRLRRKKLKEDASRRGNIIGPLLPPPTEDVGDDNGVIGKDPQGVRCNAAEKPATSNKEGEAPSQSNKKKLKHRRMAKRLAKDQLKPSSTQSL